MSFNLYFAFESTNSSELDWLYIKRIIKRYYSYDERKLSINTLFMEGRENYKESLRKIKTRNLRNSCNKLIYCFDCDNQRFNQEDIKFLKEASQYANNVGAEFVWLCRDIKKTYQRSNHDHLFEELLKDTKLSFDNIVYTKYKVFGSNIFVVLNKYLN